MTQSRVVTPVDIYDTLESDITFMGYVGDYTFKNASTGSALSIVTPSHQLPNISNVSGLEVLIHDTARPTRVDYLTSSPDILLTYQIFLLLWEPANGETLNDASIRIMQIFSGSKLYQVISEKSNEHMLVQNIIEVPNNAAIMI